MLAHGSLDFLGFPHTSIQSLAHKHIHFFRNTLSHTHAHIHTWTIMQYAKTLGSNESFHSPIHNIKAVRVSQDAPAMNDPGSVSVFFSQTSIYDLRCMFKETWIIRLRKSGEKERRRKRTTLLGISVIVPPHITFLAADSQPWKRTLVSQTTSPTCPGTREHSTHMHHHISFNDSAVRIPRKCILYNIKYIFI